VQAEEPARVQAEVGPQVARAGEAVLVQLAVRALRVVRVAWAVRVRLAVGR